MDQYLSQRQTVSTAGVHGEAEETGKRPIWQVGLGQGDLPYTCESCTQRPAHSQTRLPPLITTGVLQLA